MSDLKIRNVVAGDLDKLKAVIDSSELFPSELLDDMISGYLAGYKDSLWLTGDSDEPTFIAYCAAEQMTEGTWNLYLISLHESMQGSGIGRKVLTHVEEELKQRNVRILIIETSGLESFQSTRDFYAEAGYTEEARIRDFYQAGEDKVVFWKSLTHSR
ncbi:MAG: ribosomal protein S18 acetylase RimI-like enzyme [Polaribacter sp.]|jgi:ribosomal protein S18 acetylase RimI-like enzyme